MGAQLAGGHVGVGAGGGAGETLGLLLACLVDLLLHGAAVGTGGLGSEFAEGDGGDFDVEVDAVEQGAADFGHVAFDLGDAAMAVAAGVVAIAAGARVERGDEHEVGWEIGRAEGTADRDVAVFERLSEDFEGPAVEFGEFVEEEDAVVGEADFARGGDRAAADESGVADGVVWGAVRAAG